MKYVYIIPKKESCNLYSLFVKKELELRVRNSSFRQDVKYKWKHVKFDGWITLKRGTGNIFMSKVQSLNKQQEHRLLEAFVGFATRHFEEYIDSINIYYR